MGDVSVLLQRWRSGDGSAEEELLEMVYQELRGLAAAKMKRESWTTRCLRRLWCMKLAATKQSTASARLESRAHFFGAASKHASRTD